MEDLEKKNKGARNSSQDTQKSQSLKPIELTNNLLKAQRTYSKRSQSSGERKESRNRSKSNDNFKTATAQFAILRKNEPTELQAKMLEKTYERLSPNKAKA